MSLGHIQEEIAAAESCGASAPGCARSSALHCRLSERASSQDLPLERSPEPSVSARSPCLCLQLIASGFDFMTYSKTSWQASWVQAPSSCCVVDVDEQADGTALVLGTDNQIWYRPDLVRPSGYSQIRDLRQFSRIKGLRDGSILGISNNRLWRKLGGVTGTNGSWSLLPDSCCLIDIDEMQDGRLLGLGTDNSLWTNAMKPNGQLLPAWTRLDVPQTAGSVKMIGISVFVGGCRRTRAAAAAASGLCATAAALKSIIRVRRRRQLHASGCADTAAATAGSAWKCVPGINPTTPFTSNSKGEVYCMSQDGSTCLWRSPAECEDLALNPIANPSTTIGKCSSEELFNEKHWCFAASQLLIPQPSQCECAVASVSVSGGFTRHVDNRTPCRWAGSPPVAAIEAAAGGAVAEALAPPHAGALLGVGAADGFTYCKPSLEGPWYKVNGTCCTTGVKVTFNGTFLASARDGKVFAKDAWCVPAWM